MNALRGALCFYCDVMSLSLDVGLRSLIFPFEPRHVISNNDAFW